MMLYQIADSSLNPAKATPTIGRRDGLLAVKRIPEQRTPEESCQVAEPNA